MVLWFQAGKSKVLLYLCVRPFSWIFSFLIKLYPNIIGKQKKEKEIKQAVARTRTKTWADNVGNSSVVVVPVPYRMIRDFNTIFMANEVGWITMFLYIG